jgi:FkbM family methyltransferase
MNKGISQLAGLLEELSITLVDIGSRGGLDEDLASIRRFVHAIGFEPDPIEAERLSCLPNVGWKSSRNLPLAIGAEDGPATLYIPDSPQAASIRPHNEDMVEMFGFANLHRVRKKVGINARSLDSLRSTGELPRADYLKIDIEGAELEVLQAGRRTLAECAAIKIECSFLEQRLGQARTWEIATFLEGCGFQIIDIRDLHRWRRRPISIHPHMARAPMAYSRGRISQCDLIALRWPSFNSSPQYLLRVILIAAALGYFDSAVHLMREFTEARRFAQDEFGVCLEESLHFWSKSNGKSAVWRQISESTRGLIPLFRSLVGGIPAPKIADY